MGSRRRFVRLTIGDGEGELCLSHRDALPAAVYQEMLEPGADWEKCYGRTVVEDTFSPEECEQIYEWFRKQPFYVKQSETLVEPGSVAADSVSRKKFIGTGGPTGRCRLDTFEGFPITLQG